MVIKHTRAIPACDPPCFRWQQQLVLQRDFLNFFLRITQAGNRGDVGLSRTTCLLTMHQMVPGRKTTWAHSHSSYDPLPNGSMECLSQKPADTATWPVVQHAAAAQRKRGYTGALFANPISLVCLLGPHCMLCRPRRMRRLHCCGPRMALMSFGPMAATSWSVL